MATNLASSFATVTINGNEIIGIAENISIELMNDVTDVALGIGTSSTANLLYQKPVFYNCAFDTFELLDIEGNPSQFNFQDINNDGSSQIILNANRPIVNATDNARQFDGNTYILSGVGVKGFNWTVSLNNPIVRNFTFNALSLVTS